MHTPLQGKRLLFVITSSRWGGAQRYVYDLAVAALAAGARVAVATGGGGELVTRLRGAGIEALPLQGMQRDLSVSSDVGGYGELSRVIRAYAPDIVHVNSSKAGGLGALAARFAGVPRIIFTAHGWPFEEKRNLLWRLFAFAGSYATTLLSHTVIVVSKKDLAIGRRMPGCAHKIHLVYNGIDLTMPLGSGAVIRDAFPADAHITGTIGELNHNKNQIALIEAARANPQMYVAIVGEGDERARLEQKIHEYHLESRVKLFGFKKPEDVLRGFDVFALPSLKEGLPYVLIEAKVAGLPIEANHVGGVPDIIENDSRVFSLDRMLRETFSLYVPTNS